MRILGEGLYSHLADRKIPAFQPRLPWLGPDLQTIRNSLCPYRAQHHNTRQIFAPIDVGALSIAVDEPLGWTAQESKSLLLVHGLGGDENSSYMLMSRDFFCAQGYRVYRMNYRGVGPGKNAAPPPYSAGLTSDIRSALRAVCKDQGLDSQLFMMGFSLGGQLALRTLGEGDVPEKVAGTVTVSAPLDLSTAQRWLSRPRNKPYMRYVVNGMREDLQGVDHPRVKKSGSELKSVWDFDEYVIAPFFGFQNAEDYYAKVSCMPLIPNIAIPVAAIHSTDDTWIPAADYEKASWQRAAPVGAILCDSGGHVGFHGKSGMQPWYLKAANVFFETLD